MRNFLITKKTYKCGKLAGFEILGMVQGDNFPAYDEETAKSYSVLNMWMLWKSRKNATSKYYRIKYCFSKSRFL